MTLPRGWVLAVLPDLVGPNGLIADGDWVESKDQDVAGSIRLTQLADIGDGYFKDKSRRFLRPDQAQRLGCTLLKPNDVLIARMPDPLGRACVFPGVGQEAVTVVDACIVRVDDDEILPRWLVHFINAPQFRLAVAAEQRGSTRKRISKKSLCELALPVPPFPQQVRIADEADTHLSRLDAAVASLESAQRKLKAYRASVLKAAVEGRLVPTEAELARKEGRSYEPADVLLGRILKERRRRWEEAELAKMTAAGRTPKDDRWKAKYSEPESPDVEHLSSLPEGWCWTRLDAVSDVQLGQQRAPIHAAASEQLPYIRAANITWDGLDLSDIKTMGFPNPDRYRLMLGDVLLSEASGSPMEAGKPAIWRDEIPGACYQKTLLRVRAIRPGTLLPEYLRLVFLRDCVTGKFAAAAPGVGIVHLTAERMVAWSIPIAPLAEQQRIVDEVERLETIKRSARATVEKETRRIHRLRQAVLAWAFEGKLVDQDAGDEPAEALLARVRLRQGSSGQVLAERDGAAPAKNRGRRPRRAKVHEASAS